MVKAMTMPPATYWNIHISNKPKVWQAVLCLCFRYCWWVAWFWRIVLVRREFNSTDYQATLSLVSQIQKEDSIGTLLAVFQGFSAKMFLKPRFSKKHDRDLEQNPPAPTSMVYRSTSEPLDFIADFNGKYSLVLWSCHFSIFSSQGQVNSISITFLAELE